MWLLFFLFYFMIGEEKRKEAMNLSEPKLISPLLDGFVMGDPISNHHGVRCCPAMHTETEDKYIVKIISIPASSVQLDALLLTGAFSSKEKAISYFLELAEGVVQEAEVLQRFARLEGFVSYENWQIVPMEDGNGYDVYLLGSYRTSLERQFQRAPLTHLQAVNLGLDLCSALSVCRRGGYLYTDLKPENVYVTSSGVYKIGDLGFLPLSSLKYASLPDKYRSAYTAPEIQDAYSMLNTTVDIYALGLILYQVFNNGELPVPDSEANGVFPPPAYADYEMAEIILKACALDPANRWQDPIQMGQELASYLQRNSVNNTPIIPPPIQAEPVEEDAEEPAEYTPVEEDVPAAEGTPAEEDVPAAEDTPAEEDVPAAEDDAPAEVEDVPLEETPAETDADAEQDVPIAEPEAVDETPSEELPQDEDTPPVITDAPAESGAADEPSEAEVASEDAPQEEPPVEEVSDSEPAEADEEDADIDDLEQFVIDGFQIDETHPDEDTAELVDATLSEEVSQMLAQADELIAHKTPDPVVAPEPVDIPIPPPIVLEEEPEETPAEDEPVQPEEISEEPAQEAEAEAEEAPVTEEDDAPRGHKKKASLTKKKLDALIATLVTILILLVLAIGVYCFHQFYYIQTISNITLTGDEDYLTVQLDTEIENELLTVVCTDTYGNTLRQSVDNNSAYFQQLKPGTTYKVSVEVSGLHKLVGVTTSTYSTASQTTIANFTAITGSSDGSVILNFSVQGPDNTTWLVKYNTTGETVQTVPCTGHMAIITDLKVGSEYTFRLVPEADLYVVGTDTIQYTVSKVIYPQNLQITGFTGGTLTATWEAPADTTVKSWTVRCYNSTSYDHTVIVDKPYVAFTELDNTQAYTIDVKAEGMSESERVSVSANSITFTSILLDDSVPGQLLVTWNYEGTVPDGGWRLLYTVDGSELQLINSESNTCTISPIVPGAQYRISFELPDDVTVFGGTAEYTAPEAPVFSGYDVKAENFRVTMCRTPKDPDWNWSDVPKADYVTEFTAGEKASFILKLNAEYVTSEDQIDTLFVIRNADGKPLLINSGRSRTWTNMWYKGYAELDVPAIPQTPGSYTVDVYFAGMYVFTQAFTVA